MLTGNILHTGYCVHPSTFNPDDHPESGPVSRWVIENKDEVFGRLGANYQGKGPGALRRIPQEDLDELQAIFDVTGGTERIELVEKYSLAKAEEMGLTPDEYIKYIFTHCSPGHFNNE